MQQGMRNLRNVINVLNYKRKDIFENLKNEKVQSLSKLVLDSFCTNNGWTTMETREGNNVRNREVKRIEDIEKDQDDSII